jgi:hypothetical protein
LVVVWSVPVKGGIVCFEEGITTEKAKVRLAYCANHGITGRGTRSFADGYVAVGAGGVSGEVVIGARVSAVSVGEGSKEGAVGGRFDYGGK